MNNGTNNKVLTRPTGLTIIAILWFLGGILNLFISSVLINSDLEVLPLLSDPMMKEWFKFAVPAELGIGLFAFSLGIIQMFTIVGLWMGKSWSYKMALAIPVLAAVGWIALGGLAMSAPIEFGGIESVPWLSIGASIFWAIMILSYLRKPHVKEYLRVPIQKMLTQKVSEAPEIPEVPKRRRTLMVIAILAIAIVVVAAGIGLYTLRSPDGEGPSPTPSPTPIEYETYSKYGFSIEYPEDMTITEEGVLDATANDNSGAVGGKSFGPFEEFAVSWVKKSTPATRGDLENGLEEIFKLDNFEKTGTIVETSKSGHELIYQQGTYTEDSQTEYLIYGVWYCNIDEKLYVLGVGQTTEQNLLQNFERYLESFVCH
jgi:hypothetical protein